MKKNSIKMQDSQHLESKGKRAIEQYKCGDEGCGKFYHSYTAFYNHCKKSHGGEFPKNSLFNDKLFEGPTKNRGRPRIKKNEAKDLVQIQSMKKQNQLIQLMGTLKTKKSQQLIVYVQSPTQRVQHAVVQVKQWLRKHHQHHNIDQDFQYLSYLQQFNRIVQKNDLPQFYDPIQTHLYPNNLDSYSFSSVYNFMTRQDMRQEYKIRLEGRELLFKIYLCWSARMLSQKLFNQLLYLVLMIEKDRFEKKELAAFEKENLELLNEKKASLKKLVLQFFDCFMKEHERTSDKKSSQIKREKPEISPAKEAGRKKVSNYMAEKRFASDQGNEDQDEDDASQNQEQPEDDINDDDN